MSEIWELLDVRRSRTTPFHPQCDGLSERFNQTLIRMIAAYVDEFHTNWDENLNILAFAYNTSTHASTKCTPFETLYGYKSKVPLDLMFKNVDIELTLTADEYAANLKNTFESAYKIVETNRDVKMNTAKINHDRVVRAANFNLNDQVKMIDHSIDRKKTKKFKKFWKGPYTIISKLDGLNYVIKPTDFKGNRRVIHQSELRKFFPRDEEKLNDSQFNTKMDIKLEEERHEKQQKRPRKNYKSTDRQTKENNPKSDDEIDEQSTAKKSTTLDKGFVPNRNIIQQIDNNTTIPDRPIRNRRAPIRLGIDE